MPVLERKKKPRPSPAAGAAAAPADLADLITRDIQSGVYPLGAWLKQIELEQRYGRNRNDIRRALERLAQMRVVAHVRNRGFHVFPADGREVADIMDLRVILETAAAELIVERIGAPEVQRLDALARKFATLIRAGSMTELVDANRAFHQAFLDCCPNRELIAMASVLHNRIPSAPTTQWRSRARIEQSGREHLAMVKALAGRDAPRLKDLVTAHILQAH
jgi:DNA-binding GntR family transcriptional regulator